MHRRAGPAACVLLALLLAVACTAGPRSPELQGDRLEVLATWAGTEQQRFVQVLRAFELQTGADVTYTSENARLPDLLRERLDAGGPPDVAFLPQPGLLRELAADGHLVPLDGPTREVVEVHFPDAFRALAMAEGQEYGVWFKAANKSLVWYDVATFERLGVVPPRDLEGLQLLADRITAAGTPAFAVSGASGWTLTDWFENLYARLAGLQAYDDLASHRTPWTDASVARTLEVMGELLAPDAVAGGPDEAVATDFVASVAAVFGRPPKAAMVAEGDFVAGVITAETDAALGVDADVFPFPDGPDGAPVVVGGGDVAVQLRPSRAGAALLRFLATPEAAAVWAEAGGFLSPNLDLALSSYPDEVSRTVARQLLEAGDAFRFDLSDLQPAAFGGSEETGLMPELRAFLLHRDVAVTGKRLEQAARAAGAGEL